MIRGRQVAEGAAEAGDRAEETAVAAEQARIAGSPFATFAEALASELRRTAGFSDRRTVREDELMARVAAWSPAQTPGVIGVFERFRTSIARDGWTDMPTMLRAVGLLRGKAEV